MKKVIPPSRQSQKIILPGFGHARCVPGSICFSVAGESNIKHIESVYMDKKLARPPPPLPEGHPTFKASESQPWVNLAPKQTLCFVTLVCEQLAIICKELLQKFSRLCWIGMEGNSRVGDYPFSYKQAFNR